MVHAVRRSPLTAALGSENESRSLHVDFAMDETKSGVGFLGIFPVFPCQKFHSTISPR